MVKFGLAALGLLGLLLSGFGVSFIADGLQARSWPVVDGRVVSTTVRVDMPTGNSGATREAREAHWRYYPSITYRWVVDGRPHTGSRYQLGTTHPKLRQREEAQAAAARYPVGSTVRVHYNPANPDQAVLETAPSVGIYVPLLFGLVLIAATGFGILRARRVRRAADAAVARP